MCEATMKLNLILQNIKFYSLWNTQRFMVALKQEQYLNVMKIRRLEVAENWVGKTLETLKYILYNSMAVLTTTGCASQFTCGPAHHVSHSIPLSL
jgi:hypothetical protein